MTRALADFHNHLIPGVDDGATDAAEAAAGIKAMMSHGVVAIIATPHVDGSLTRDETAIAERLSTIDAGWATLEALAASKFPELDLRRGAELKLDVPNPDLSDARLRLDGGRFVLVEFAFMSVPPQSQAVLETISQDGYTPILAHPERYVGIQPDSPLPEQWKRAGALLQINAGSLSGRYGPEAQAIAVSLIRRGLADYMCSDYHARGRPAMEGAQRLLVKMEGEEQLDTLTSVNPRRLLAGEGPLPVQPLREQPGVLGRLSRLFR